MDLKKKSISEITAVLLLVILASLSSIIVYYHAKYFDQELPRQKIGFQTIKIEGSYNGKLIVRNIGYKPVYIDSIFIKDPVNNKLIYYYRLNNKLVIQPRQVVMIDLPDPRDIGLGKEANVNVFLGYEKGLFPVGKALLIAKYHHILGAYSLFINGKPINETDFYDTFLRVSLYNDSSVLLEFLMYNVTEGKYYRPNVFSNNKFDISWYVVYNKTLYGYINSAVHYGSKTYKIFRLDHPYLAIYNNMGKPVRILNTDISSVNFYGLFYARKLFVFDDIVYLVYRYDKGSVQGIFPGLLAMYPNGSLIYSYYYYIYPDFGNLCSPVIIGNYNDTHLVLFIIGSRNPYVYMFIEKNTGNYTGGEGFKLNNTPNGCVLNYLFENEKKILYGIGKVKVGRYYQMFAFKATFNSSGLIDNFIYNIYNSSTFRNPDAKNVFIANNKLYVVSSNGLYEFETHSLYPLRLIKISANKTDVPNWSPPYYALYDNNMFKFIIHIYKWGFITLSSDLSYNTTFYVNQTIPGIYDISLKIYSIGHVNIIKDTIKRNQYYHFYKKIHVDWTTLPNNYFDDFSKNITIDYNNILNLKN